MKCKKKPTLARVLVSENLRCVASTSSKEVLAMRLKRAVAILLMACVLCGGAVSVYADICICEGDPCPTWRWPWHWYYETCDEYRENRCVNDECVPQNPLYDDCVVYCRWDVRRDAFWFTCYRLEVSSAFCVQ